MHRPGQNLRNPDWPVLEKLIKDDLKSLREVICADADACLQVGCDVSLTIGSNLSCRKRIA